MKAPLYNQTAEKIGDVDLSDQIFAVAVKPAVLAEVVRVQQMNLRQGSAHTKTRGEVRGGGKKPWKQKGTGRARAGSIRSPIWRGGGVTLGPRKERNWHRSLNAKVKNLSLRMSLSDKVNAGKLVVVDSIHLEFSKTRLMNQVLAIFRKNDTGLGKKPLLIFSKSGMDLSRASRNLAGVAYGLASNLNTLSVVKADSLLVLQDSLPVIEKIFAKAKTG